MVPEFKAPPSGTIDALERQCRAKKDTATCDWIIDLDKLYEKLDRASKL